MRILFLSFYFEPDHGPGAIRNTLIAKALSAHNDVDKVDVITTTPHKWTTKHTEKKVLENTDKISVHKIDVSSNKNGIIGQLKSFFLYQKYARHMARTSSYDLIYASSSRLGTAAIGAYLSQQKKALFYLDVRDLFIETIEHYLPHIIFKPLKLLLSKINDYSIRRADRINVLSSAFIGPISRINQRSRISSIYHGVDPKFASLSNRPSNENSEFNSKPSEKKVLLYAGNIGFGQGLEQIVPKISKALPTRWEIHIYGDGPEKDKLIENVSRLKNVSLFSPVEQNDLMQIYAKADALLLSLNANAAFEKSLPSKFFEYCGSGKPIITYCKGQLENFVLENKLEGVFVFNRWEKDSFLYALNQINKNYYDRSHFNKKWQRDQQIQLMVEDIISLTSSRAHPQY